MKQSYPVWMNAQLTCRGVVISMQMVRSMKQYIAWFVMLPVLFAVSSCQSADAQRSGFVSFQREVIDDSFPGGYGVSIADIDGDGRLDILALGYVPGTLAWYRNPDWQRQAIDTGTERLIDVAPHDITGNGLTDLVLASEFRLNDPDSGGLVSWLENPRGLPSDTADGNWARHDIDRIPTSHRLRWADVSGRSVPVLINLPIVGQGAAAPEYEGGVALTAYTVPGNPQSRWPSVVLDDSLEMAHGLTIIDWNGNGREQMLTASFDGVHLFSLASRNRLVDRQVIIEAQPGQRPAIGASDVVVGHSGGSDNRFLATIEPWHGNEVVVYRPGPEGSDPWHREVIDTTLSTGHALLTADLNNDGNDEVIAGGRGQPYSLNIYRYDPASGSWDRRSLDSRVAVSGLAVADITGNGFLDIVAVGSGTSDVVLYRNSGR